MTRYVAFLGGINVGGHRVSMADLKRLFEELGLADVSTYIASGNVLFSSTTEPVEAVIEEHLGQALGYAVPAFIRRSDRLAEIAAASPFGEVGGTVAVGFLRAAPRSPAAVAALSTPVDTLQVVGTELWWHLPNGFSGSQLKPKDLAAAGIDELTTRNLNTVKKIAAKLP